MFNIDIWYIYLRGEKMEYNENSEHSVRKYLERRTEFELKTLLLQFSSDEDSEGYNYAKEIIEEILRSRNGGSHE